MWLVHIPNIIQFTVVYDKYTLKALLSERLEAENFDLENDVSFVKNNSWLNFL